MRILAFDPSLRNLGVAFGISDSGKLTMEYVDTFYLDKLVDKYSIEPEWDIDPNTRRVALLEIVITKLINNYKPDMIVIELPIFNGKNPKSLQVQMKAILTLEMAAFNYSGKLRSNIVQYMPNVIKLGVGVNPRTDKGGKHEITKALTRLENSSELIYTQSCYGPTIADEHANDAVAMAYTKHRELENVF